jgi:hypothetical protein
MGQFAIKLQKFYFLLYKLHYLKSSALWETNRVNCDEFEQLMILYIPTRIVHRK